MKLHDKAYDWLKWICMVGIPAIVTLYNVIAAIWSLPFAEEITATAAAICTFIGAILGISTAEYNKNEKEGNA